MPDHILKALLKKNAGEAVPKLTRKLQGPLSPNKGKYKPKPKKVKGKLDPVQHEANSVENVNTKGDRNAGELNFKDDEGRVSYMNKSGDRLQYSNLDTKKGNNSKLSSRRQRDGDAQTRPDLDQSKFYEGAKADTEAQTRPDVDQKDFYKGALADTEARHIAGLDQYGWLYDGLDNADQMAMTGLLEKNGVFAGNNSFNRADLSANVHNKLHRWMTKNGMTSRRRASIKDLPFEDRMKFVQELINETKATEKEMFRLRQQELWGATEYSIADFNDSFNGATKPGAIDRSSSDKS